jgi:hypothetical protein
VKFWRKVWESNPQEFSGSDDFQDRLALPMPNLPITLAEVVGVEPARADIARDREPGSCHTVRRDFLESGRGDTSRTCIVLRWTQVWSLLHCQLCYAPLNLHAAGLEPAVSHSGDPDLQSGAFAAEATHAKSVIVKNDEGRELEAPEDTLRRTLLPRMARPSGLSQSTRGRAIQRRHPCPHLSLHRYFSYQTTKRAGGFNREAQCPLQQFS